MVLSTLYISEGAKVRSPDINDGNPVTVRLRGNWDDVKAAVNHWRIQVEWRQAVSQLSDDCTVYGMLHVRG